MRAKRADTQRRRLAQMLDELEKGDVYMKMSWNPKHWRSQVGIVTSNSTIRTARGDYADSV